MAIARVFLAGCFAFAITTTGWAGSAVPVTVSPGSPTGALISDTCPTFSWGAVPGAKSYELIVYRVVEAHDEAEPVLRQTFPGAASSWTPSLDRCLERGGRYAWSVRAVGHEGAADWSAASLFEVATGKSEAEIEESVAIVWQYLGEVGAGAAPGSGERQEAPVGVAPNTANQSARESIAGPAPQSGLAGDPDLQVNGAAVVTTATLGIGLGLQLCEAMDYRYVDRGDGTVLDCNTDLLWLKDASCADLAGTDANGQADWATAQSAAAALADGTCGLTDGSSAGDWRQPTISELCSAWSGVNLFPCPAAAASNSLIDSSVGIPTVVNAKGDGVWSEGNAFAEVPSSDPNIWSATPNGAASAWFADLTTGSVSTDNRINSFFVWPVRDGP